MKGSVISFIALVLCVACTSDASNISLRVVDEDGEPIVGAKTLISFLRSQQKDTKGHYGKSDEEGHFSAKGTNTVGVFARVEERGFYKWEKRDFYGNQDYDVTVVLRKKENPIALLVREMKLEFPAYDEWLGFDFEVGDWVAPQGKGKSRDILFKFHREYRGSSYSEKELAKIIPKVKRIKKDRGELWDSEEFRIKTAKWDAKLSVGFSSELEGIVEVKKGYFLYSELKMPHQAPEEGYQGELKYEQTSYEPSKFNKRIGYFIRTRVTEVDGKIITANYAKLGQDIKVNASGEITFTYYYNRTVNDRNLEFRPTLNIAIEQRRGYEP